MAKFTIYSKDGSVKRYVGTPKYNGSYLNTPYLEFSDVSSPIPIVWEVGDYVEYSRTGLTYRLYSLPQPNKQARRNSSGEAFVYDSVKLYSDVKQLEIAIFHDVVMSDNGIHFSTREETSTYEDVYGIATRIQECMDEMYPGKWLIQVMDVDETADAELYTLMHEQKEFSISGGSCLEALTEIYNTWETIGWIHTYDAATGKNVITIGKPNKRGSDNTTDTFLYGKGNGLTALKKSFTNEEDIATRLYIYGSERNLISRYYNSLDILNAKSVDICNLMLPLDVWGKTTDENGDLKPDARKSYLESTEATETYGLRPKRVYFDGGDNDEVYPSIENFTAGELRTAKAKRGETDYVPSLTIYPDDSERLDLVKSATKMTDDGVQSSEGNYAKEIVTVTKERVDAFADNFETFFICDALEINDFGNESVEGEAWLVLKAPLEVDFKFQHDIEKVSVVCGLQYFYYDDNGTLRGSSGAELEVVDIEHSNMQSKFTIPTTNVKVEYGRIAVGVRLRFKVYVTQSDNNYTDIGGLAYTIYAGDVTLGARRSFSHPFNIEIKQIGFDITDREATGDGLATISMKSGMCGGRDFTITKCVYQEDKDSWLLTVKRSLDDSLNIYFPNENYQIEAGDAFVLVDLTMPELYIDVASERLLALGKELLEKSSKGQEYYEPEIDAKVMARSSRIIKEGMYMEIADDDIIGESSEYVIIDTLEIDEGEEAIPTYKVTLREKKGVSFKESVSGSINDLSSKVLLLGGLARVAQKTANGANDLANSLKDSASTNNAASQNGFINAKERIDLLQNSVEGFTEGINPVSVQTLALLVGSENLQFRFVDSEGAEEATSDYPISYDNATKVLTCASSMIQHQTLNISSIIADDTTRDSERAHWVMNYYESSVLEDAATPYYLYAKVAYDGTNALTEDNDFILSKNAIGYDSEEGYLHLLVGILSSEINGTRTFSKLHGYTEVKPGQIVTDTIEGSGLTIDLVNGKITGTVQLASGSSGLTRLSEWKAAQEQMDSNTDGLSDLEYLKTLFAEGTTTISGGAVMTNIVGVGEKGATSISAGINGSKDYGYDTTHGRLMFFAGSNGVTDSQLKSAKTRIYEDGTIKTNQINATGGTIGGLEIINNITGQDGVYTMTIFPSYTQYVRESESQWFSRSVVTIGRAENTLSGISVAGLSIDISGGVVTSSSGTTSTNDYSRVGIELSVEGAGLSDSQHTFGNHALLIPKGDITGFRLRTRRITQSTTLSTLDSIILCNNTAGQITLTLPEGCEDGQMFYIRKISTGSGDKNRVYVTPSGSDQLYPRSYCTGETPLSAGETTMNASVARGNAILCVYDKLHGCWWTNHMDYNS